MRIFISYADADRGLAEALARALKAPETDVWFDQWQLIPGDGWFRGVESALRESDAMVVLVSTESVQSRWVKSEIDFALGHASYKHRVIPVLLDDEAEEQMPWILRTFKKVRLATASRDAIEEAATEIARALAAAPRMAHEAG